MGIACKRGQTVNLLDTQIGLVEAGLRVAVTPSFGVLEAPLLLLFRRVYWDTDLAASDPVLRLLRDVAGINQVLFGADFPYLRRDLAAGSKQRILQSSEQNHSERRAILGGNASRLLPSRFRSLTKGALEATKNAT
jgi:predicted TIM-barrel fold metal-dependent hydrolase